MCLLSQRKLCQNDRKCRKKSVAAGQGKFPDKERTSNWSVKRFHFRVPSVQVAVLLFLLLLVLLLLLLSCSTFLNMHIKFSRSCAVVGAAPAPAHGCYCWWTKIPFGTELCVHIEFVASLKPEQSIGINRYFISACVRPEYLYDSLFGQCNWIASAGSSVLLFQGSASCTEVGHWLAYTWM